MRAISGESFSCQPLFPYSETRVSSEYSPTSGERLLAGFQMTAALKPVERRTRLAPAEFFATYVKNAIPVAVTGALSGSVPVERWSLDYFRKLVGDQFVSVKYGDLSQLRSSSVLLSDYLDEVERYESGLAQDRAGAKDRPAYLHDVPLVSMLGGAVTDLAGLPAAYFPKWYGNQWWKFAQFFLGPSGSVTPLHFDTLLTHNLFFQVAGRKRFILLRPGEAKYCYRRSWRWFAVDAETPDYAAHPLFRKAEPAGCVIGPGDMLYLPPGTLHQVRSLDCGISFNVDWHTPDSAARGIAAVLSGMPLQNLYYNTLLALGLCTGISADRILPFYRSYLNYRS
jgi:hypothetical protein